MSTVRVFPFRILLDFSCRWDAEPGMQHNVNMIPSFFSFGFEWVRLLNHSPAVRDYFLSAQLHRTFHRDMVDQPSPVEVADKLLHREFLPQRPDPFHAVVRVAEDPHLPVNALEGGLLDAGPQLLVRLVALDWGIG